MRIVKKPKVYLIARPMLAAGFEEFLEEQGLEWPSPMQGSDAQTVTELAGRCCYMSFGAKAGSKTNARYIRNLIGMNPDGTFRDGPAHGSVLEHGNYSFLVVGGGRGFSHEQVRHRAGWAYSQLSTRYCDFEREEEEGTWDPGFTIPPLAQLSEATTEFMEAKLHDSQAAYCELLGMIENDLLAHPEFMENLSQHKESDAKRMLRKAARGAARDILPIATEAIMTMTANTRAIWNTLYLRASEHAEAAIRDVYVQIAKIMQHESPTLFSGIKFVNVWDGSEAVELPRPNL
jgi:thymidylate synthase (FAD)